MSKYDKKSSPMQFIGTPKVLRVSRHYDTCLAANRILALPEAGHGLLLGIELQARLAVESVRSTTSNTLLVTSKGEHGQRDGNRDVDTNLAGLDVLLETRRGRARPRKDSGAIAIFVGINQVDGVI